MDLNNLDFPNDVYDMNEGSIRDWLWICDFWMKFRVSQTLEVIYKKY